MNMTVWQRFTFWLCDRLGHQTNQSNLWIHAGHRIYECPRCHRLARDPVKDDAVIAG